MSQSEASGANFSGDGDGSNYGPGMDRRRFLLRVLGTATLLSTTGLPVMAGPFTAGQDSENPVPADKKLHPDWVKSLFERGGPTVYRGDDLKYIGMPVGGLCTGQLYLGGDGKLWHWDIFNRHVDTGSGGPHYASPPAPNSPLEQGFALRITTGGKTQTRTLDAAGFADVRFRGEYPIGTVEYRDAAAPLAVTLEAFSPFIPLATDDSSLPATILRFTLKNTSAGTVEATLAGWLQNAVCLHHTAQPGTRTNRIVKGKGFSLLECAAKRSDEPTPTPQPDVVFEDWNKETYDGWTVEGDAFGTRPVKRTEIIPYQGDVGGDGDRMVNTHASAPADNVGGRDAKTGKLTGRAFVVTHRFVHFWIGGGEHLGRTGLNLLVGGKTVRSATGRNDNRMTLQTFDVRALKGQEAHFEIVDRETGPWGHVGVGRITFSDQPAPAGGAMETWPDFGTMTLALRGKPAEHVRAAGGGKNGFDGPGDETASATLDETLIGAVGRTLRMAPGKSATVEFVLAWHFPNLELPGMGRVGRHYATRFASARAVTEYVCAQFARLSSQTRLWRDTWYDSTLPRWFLDRTFLNTSILATSTAFRFADGRFYGWEGVGCCAGTCTHVWHYAQAPARLFPDLERAARTITDYGIAFDAATGRIRFRGEHNDHWAADGQAGCILRAYREHQMSANDAFLKGIWPRVRQSLEFLMNKDADRDGILDGPQHNTLDADWFGQIAWLSSLYVAALRAGEAMATEVGDAAFALRARAIADAGSRKINETLFNGEYYVQLPDPGHAKTVGSYDSCEIDQVFGQHWAHQVGLGRILPQPNVKKALASLWKYNFAPDVGPYRAAHKPGRWYALAGEGGLLMATWPRGEGSRVGEAFDFYFNECMTGFEYQAAGHLLWENMPLEGLAITRAVHDRYHAARRNPWNEVECGDHYARAMASYGVFLAACGFEHHGPKGHLAFAPRLNAENFQAAFTAAEGWGRFSQKITNGQMNAEIALRWGRLRLRTLALILPSTSSATTAQVTLDGRPVTSTLARRDGDDDRLTITFPADVIVKVGQKLAVRVG